MRLRRAGRRRDLAGWGRLSEERLDSADRDSADQSHNRRQNLSAQKIPLRFRVLHCNSGAWKRSKKTKYAALEVWKGASSHTGWQAERRIIPFL